MDLSSLLSARRDALAEAWFQRSLEAYPADTARFLRAERDPFANPVGAAFRKGIPVLLDFLLGVADRESAAAALGEIVRIRAVQEASPSKGLAFLFGVRALLREACAAEGAAGGGRWDELEARVDGLALLGFDLWSADRERMGEIRVREMRRRMYVMERASGLLEPGPEPEGGGEPPGG